MGSYTSVEQASYKIGPFCEVDWMKEDECEMLPDAIHDLVRMYYLVEDRYPSKVMVADYEKGTLSYKGWRIEVLNSVKYGDLLPWIVTHESGAHVYLINESPYAAGGGCDLSVFVGQSSKTALAALKKFATDFGIYELGGFQSDVHTGKYVQQTL